MARLIEEFGNISLPTVPDSTQKYNSLRDQFSTNWGAYAPQNPEDVAMNSVQHIQLASAIQRRRDLWRDMTDKQFKQRVAGFNPAAIEVYGQEVYHYASKDKYTDEQVHQIADVMNQAAPFISSRTTFAGVNRGFEVAYGFARATGQTSVVNLMDKLTSAGMSHDEQSIVWNAIRNPAAYVKLINYDSADADAWADHWIEQNPEEAGKYQTPDGGFDYTAAHKAAVDLYDSRIMERRVTLDEWQDAWSKLTEVVPGLQLIGQRDLKTGELQGATLKFDSSMEGSEYKQGIEQLFNLGNGGFFRTDQDSGNSLFENLIANRGDYGSDLGKGISVPFGMTMQALSIPFNAGTKAIAAQGDAVNWLWERAAFAAGLHAPGETWDEYHASAGKRVTDLANRVNYNVSQWSNDALRAIGEGGGPTGSLPIPVKAGEGQTFEQFVDERGTVGTMGLVSAPLTAFDNLTTSIARPMVSGIMGVNENDPNYDATLQTVNGIIQIFLLKKGGEFFRGVKAGETFLPGQAEIELGINKPFMETKFGGSVLGGVAENRLGRILNSPFLHPSRAANYIAKWLGHTLTDAPLEKAVVKNSAVSSYFDAIEYVRKNFPADERLGELTKRYGPNVAAELHSTLLDAPRATMGDAFIEYVKSNERRVQQMKALDVDRSDIKARLKAYDEPGFTDGEVINVPAADLIDHTAYPKRTRILDQGDMVGRTREQSFALRKSLRERGYDPTHVPEGATEPIGNVVGHYYPETGQLLIEEGHHRLGQSADLGQDVPLEIKVEEGVPAGKYDPIERSGANPAMDELSQLGQEGLPQTPDRFIDPDTIRGWKFAGDDILTQVGRDSMQLRLRALDTQARAIMAEAQDHVPVREFPSSSFYRRSVFSPVTRAERYFHTLLKPLGDLPKKFADEMPQHPKLFNPTANQKPFKWAEHNAEVMTHFLDRVGMDQPRIGRLIQEMYDLRNTRDPQAFYKWARKVEGEIDAVLPLDTPAATRIALTNFFRSPVESRPYSKVEVLRKDSMGRVVMDTEWAASRQHELDPMGSLTPVPTSPSEFIGELTLPDIDLAIDATSWMRRTARSNKAFDWGFYKPARFTLHAGTALWKAPILALRVPAVISRIQLEQMMRGRLFGDYRALNFSPGGVPMNYAMVDYMIENLSGWEGGLAMGDPRSKGFAHPSEVDLGSLKSQILGTHDSEMYHWESTVDYRIGSNTPHNEVWNGWSEQIYKVRQDWFDRNFVASGMDIEKTIREIEAGHIDPAYIHSQVEVLRESYGGKLTDDQIIRRWLERKKQSIEMVTRGDPEILHSIIHGRAGEKYKVPGETHMPDGKLLSEHVADLNNRMDSIRHNLRTLQEIKEKGLMTPELHDTVLVMRDRLMHEKEEMQRVVDTYGDNVKRSSKGTALDDPTALRRYLKDRWEGGTIEMPSEVRVKRHRSPEEEVGPKHWAHTVRRAWDGGWYSLYRPMSWADIKFTRGSVYYQAAERAFLGLKEQGYTDGLARQQAQVLAADFTRDLMYDLSARTSAHRAVKDLMWFAPATQEILNTWLLRIPRQYGSLGIGIPLLVGKVHAWMNLMKGVGIIQTDAEGRDRVMIPGLARLLNEGAFGFKLPGVTVPDTIYTTPQGFNLVLSNPLPGMSILPSWAIGRAAREWGGPFKDISRWMEGTGLLFSEDTTAVPRQISYFWEAVTGHKVPFEFLSPAYATASFNRQHAVAMQLAFGEMLNNGNTPPRIEDFADTTDKLTGEKSLSAEAEAKYHDALATWNTEFIANTEDHFRGAALVGFLGSTIAPSSLYTTDSDKEAFNAMWAQILAKNPDGDGFNEMQMNMLNDYLSAHPGGVAFNTWYSQYTGTEPAAPQATDPGDSDWYQAFYDGQRETLSPEEYSLKLQVTESHRYYAGQLHSQLVDIAGKDLDPVKLLLNGYQKQIALDQYAYDWDRYQALNPEAAAVLTAGHVAADTALGIPIRTYEAERLSQTVRGFRQLAPFFSTEGVRKGDYRALMGQLSGYYSQNGEFGEPNTKSEKALDWYFSNVFQPWADNVFPMYDRARKLGESNLNSSAIYDRIREANDAAQDVASRTHNGVLFPTPEEMLYSNKSPQEQRLAQYSWASKPVTWLTNFQMGKVGYIPFAGRDEMMDKERQLENDYYHYLKANDVSSSSKEYDAVTAQYHRFGADIAKDYGSQGSYFWQLNTGSPAARLSITGFGSGSQNWQWAVNESANITRQLIAHDLSPRGYSESATDAKKWFYNQIRDMYAYDPTFRSYMEDMAMAIPEAGEDARSGVPLWEAVFFGQFDTKYAPDDLLKLGGGI